MFLSSPLLTQCTICTQHSPTKVTVSFKAVNVLSDKSLRQTAVFLVHSTMWKFNFTFQLLLTLLMWVAWQNWYIFEIESLTTYLSCLVTDGHGDIFCHAKWLGRHFSWRMACSYHGYNWSLLLTIGLKTLHSSLKRFFLYDALLQHPFTHYNLTAQF